MPGDARRTSLLRWTALIRFSAAALVVSGLLALGAGRRRDRLEIERARSALLDELHARSAALTEADRGFLARADASLERLAGPYEGDVVADELRGPGAIDAIFARPAVYVRGPVSAFTASAAVAEAAATSFKDALMLCLVEPPAARTEKSMMAQVRLAYDGGAGIEEHSPQVRLLEEAELGLPFLLAPWEERVRGAAATADLSLLKAALHRAPTGQAAKAAKAQLLLCALDEPGTVGPTELDGERAHDVRLGLVELSTSRVLLRVRRHVDPAWISKVRRAEYAVGLDSCALGYDVRSELARRD
jgi:hypothetical protein